MLLWYSMELTIGWNIGWLDPSLNREVGFDHLVQDCEPFGYSLIPDHGVG